MWAWKHPHGDGTLTYTKLEGQVVLDHVDFGYTPEKEVLHDITLYAEPGQKVAFVGATGAGKTILFSALARDIRLNTTYARAGDEAHTLARALLTHTGDINPSAGVLTIRLDPLPTARATRAAQQLCQHLTATATTYPGTQMIIRYEVKPRP